MAGQTTTNSAAMMPGPGEPNGIVREKRKKSKMRYIMNDKSEGSTKHKRHRSK